MHSLLINSPLLIKTQWSSVQQRGTAKRLLTRQCQQDNVKGWSDLVRSWSWCWSQWLCSWFWSWTVLTVATIGSIADYELCQQTLEEDINNIFVVECGYNMVWSWTTTTQGVNKTFEEFLLSDKPSLGNENHNTVGMQLAALCQY